MLWGGGRGAVPVVGRTACPARVGPSPPSGDGSPRTPQTVGETVYRPPRAARTPDRPGWLGPPVGTRSPRRGTARIPAPTGSRTSEPQGSPPRPVTAAQATGRAVPRSRLASGTPERPMSVGDRQCTRRDRLSPAPAPASRPGHRGRHVRPVTAAHQKVATAPWPEPVSPPTRAGVTSGPSRCHPRPEPVSPRRRARGPRRRHPRAGATPTPITSRACRFGTMPRRQACQPVSRFTPRSSSSAYAPT